MTLTLEQQLEHFDRKAEQAYARCLRSFKDRKPEIIQRARQRLVEGQGIYGDDGFHWTHARLHEAELEEMADLVNYRLMKIHQGWPT